MCLIGELSDACARGQHDQCDRWAHTSKGCWGTSVPCICTCRHEAARRRLREVRERLNAAALAAGRPDLVYKQEYYLGEATG
jgi:hypothetical protein